MRTADFDYELPPELIAQVPAERRDASRLFVLARATGQIQHQQFTDLLTHLRPGDVLVLNNSRVIPARLRGVNAKTGGQFEVLLLEENSVNDWWVMLRPGKRGPVGTKIIFRNHDGDLTDITAEVIATNDEGHRRLRFTFANNVSASPSLEPAQPCSLSPSEGERAGVRGLPLDRSSRREEAPFNPSETSESLLTSATKFRERDTPNILNCLDQLGELPLPPYIERPPGKTSEHDLDRYQTVFAEPVGSVAAPTAGLHFTPTMLDAIRTLGVQVAFVTLHVGLGTFAPVKADELSGHVLHEERFEVSEATANLVNNAKQNGHRIIAVGTTSVRVLESAAAPSLSPSDGERAGVRGASVQLTPGPGRTRIFIHPPHTFKIVDALLTNFHLPRSTLLMLVSAFAAPGELRGRELMLRAYAEAVREHYRFFSYGDAMFIA